MSRAGVVTRLALRELWITFRLLLLLAAYIGTGAAVALVPAPMPVMLERLAIGLAASSVIGAATAAWSLSRERGLGRAGWLVTRSIPRATILVGWFLALGIVTALGLAAAGVLGWLAATGSGTVTVLHPFAFGAVVASIGCGALALIGLGLLVGALLRPGPATLIAAVLGTAAVGVPWLAAPRVAAPPEALALLPALASPITVAAQGAGGSMVAAGFLLLLARVVLDRVDL
ncbi:MAG TPA: hypothetical protein VF364_11410 [Candidatus Limnocylindria bacterium]